MGKILSRHAQEPVVVEAREYNHQQQEKLMEIKIENLNFQEEIKTLNKKLKEQTQQLLALQNKYNAS